MHTFAQYFPCLAASVLLCSPVSAHADSLETGFEKAVGRIVTAALSGAGLESDIYLNAYVRRIGADVARFAPRREIPYRFVILNSQTANAFAAPGGTIFVTRGLLDSVSSDDELAGVLAHECGHVSKKHAVRQIVPNLAALGGESRPVR